MKWTTLTLGALILLYCGGWFVAMAHLMKPYGMSPFEWSFLSVNPRWMILPPVGLTLLVTGLVLFLRSED